MEIEKDMKSENGMSSTLPKFSQSDISNANTSSFNIDNMDFFDTDSSIISEFMSLSLNAKIEKFNSNFSYRKLKDKNSSNTFLHYICMNDDNYPMMNLIKPTLKEMDSRNNLGQTPLHISLRNKNYKISKYLIENGANVNLSDNNLDTCLHLSIKYGNIDIIKLLIIFILSNKELKINNNNNKNTSNIMNGNDKIQKYDNNILNNHKKIINQKKSNIQPFHKKLYYINNINNNTLMQRNNINMNTVNSDINDLSIRNNIFLSNNKTKNRQRTSSTSLINSTHSNNNKTYQDQIYLKKIVQRSQSGARKYIKAFPTQTGLENKNNIINNDILPNITCFSPTTKNNIPRKTDFPMQNEMFLETDNDNENESVEEEESIIRETPDNNNNPDVNLNFKCTKTIKITPLTKTKNKKNPYSQIDSYVSAIHKNDQGITESDGYINEDGLFIIEPSIDISNVEDTISEQSQYQTENESFKNNETEKKDLSTKDDLYTFLKNIGMEEYNELLINEGFDDINLIISQMKTGLPITDEALREIGIEKPGDRAKILIRVQETAKMFDFKIPFEAVYHINKKEFNLLKYDFHVKAMQNWLKKIQLQNYLENFYNNGYFSPELVFIQKASKFPINDTILERDLKILNVNDRKLIMSSISSNSKNYISELQKKSSKKKHDTNKNNEKISKDKEKEDSKCTIF